MGQRAGRGGSVESDSFGGQAAAQPSTVGAHPLGDPLNSVRGGSGPAGGGLGGLLEQLAAAAGAGSSPGAQAGVRRGPRRVDQRACRRGLRCGDRQQGDHQQGGRWRLLCRYVEPVVPKLGEPKVAPTPQQDAAAGLMLRAMLQAAKCDGKIDEGEKKKLLEALGDASSEDMAFVNRELSAPVDVQGLVKQVPKGLEKSDLCGFGHGHQPR